METFEDVMRHISGLPSHEWESFKDDLDGVYDGPFSSVYSLACDEGTLVIKNLRRRSRTSWNAIDEYNKCSFVEATVPAISGVQVPQCLGFDNTHNLVYFRALKGRRLDLVVNDVVGRKIFDVVRLLDTIGRIGRWMTVLHGNKIDSCANRQENYVRRMTKSVGRSVHLPSSTKKRILEFVDISKVWSLQSPAFLVHGDMAVINVLVDRKAISIIDFTSLEYGDREADVVEFINSLRFKTRLRHVPLLRYLCCRAVQKSYEWQLNSTLLHWWELLWWVRNFDRFHSKRYRTLRLGRRSDLGIAEWNIERLLAAAL